MSTITIIGRKVALSPLPDAYIKRLSFGEKLSFEFFEGEYRDVNMIFLRPKGKNPSPKNCVITALRLEEIFGCPIVFILNPGPTYERQRLVEKDVYFVMSDKYVNLPMTVALEKTTTRKAAVKLTPAAQYILLYHLQIRSIEGLTVRAVANLMPYSYSSVAIGITCLCDLGLCEKNRQGQLSKVVNFKYRHNELWERAAEVTINPVEKIVFCDGLKTDHHFPTSGINALAHYTMLNPDKELWTAITPDEYRELLTSDKIDDPNEYDGKIVVEVWKYPPIAENGESPEYVDRLSLALTLKDDNDPRVENEVERMVKEIKWLD